MATLPTQTFTQLVRGQVSAIQGAASGLVDFTVGSILRAVVESVSQVVLWLQGLIIALLTTTRFATSVGPDADSWAADFDFVREGAASASTQEIFGRFSTTLQGVVGIGATVETSDGSQQYVVVIDAANPSYSAALGGYVLGPGAATITCPIQASVAGSAANAAPGAINTITSSIPGIDYCANVDAVTNGQDAESDAAFKRRFVAYINSLSKAIRLAIEVAVEGVALNASCSVIENYGYAGNGQPGFFTVVVNDGTGQPTDAFMSACAEAIEATRGLCIQYGVFAPILIATTVTLSAQIATGYSQSAVIAAVSDAITNYIGQLALGETLAWSRIVQLAMNASPGVVEVSNVRLSGGQADVVASPMQLVQCAGVQVQIQSAAAPTFLIGSSVLGSSDEI
jgi:uncharacterized phage protein gp47/JayE